MATAHYMGAPKVQIEAKQHRCEHFHLTPGGYMICTGTSGNGVRIFMVIILTEHLRIPQDPQQALTGCFAAAAGTTTPGTAARRAATGARPATGTTSSGSGLSCPQVSNKAGKQADSEKGSIRTEAEWSEGRA